MSFEHIGAILRKNSKKNIFYFYFSFETKKNPDDDNSYTLTIRTQIRMNSAILNCAEFKSMNQQSFRKIRLHNKNAVYLLEYTHTHTYTYFEKNK